MADKATRISQLTTYFPNNDSKLITPALLREYLDFIIDDTLFIADNFSNDTAEASGLATKVWSIQAVKDYVAGSGSTSAGVSVSYTFDTGTSSGPASGEMRLNNATPASATEIYFHDTSGNGDASAVIGSLSSSSQIIFQDASDIDTYQIYDVTGDPTDNGSDWTVPVVHVSGGSTTITDAATVSVIFGLGVYQIDTLTSNLDADSFKIVNLGNGTASGDAVNKGQLDTVQALIEVLRNGVETLTISANAVTWDLSTDAPFAELELTSNVTTFTISNQAAGSWITLLVKQDATGSRTLATPTGYTATGAGFTIYSNGNAYTVCKFYKGTAYSLAATNYDASGGGGGQLIDNYGTMGLLIADQGSQTSGAIYRVDDASGHSDVTTGYAYLEYLGTSVGDETDYNLISSEETISRLTTAEGNISTNASDIATNIADIATNAADIATNTSDIATNTSDIATNTADIATNASDITDIENTLDDRTVSAALNLNSTSTVDFSTAKIRTVPTLTNDRTITSFTNASERYGHVIIQVTDPNGFEVDISGPTLIDVTGAPDPDNQYNILIYYQDGEYYVQYSFIPTDLLAAQVAQNTSDISDIENQLGQITGEAYNETTDTYYSTFAAALSAASDGDQIDLLRSITGSTAINISTANLQINLRGNVISCVSDSTSVRTIDVSANGVRLFNGQVVREASAVVGGFGIMAAVLINNVDNCILDVDMIAKGRAQCSVVWGDNNVINGKQIQEGIGYSSTNNYAFQTNRGTGTIVNGPIIVNNSTAGAVLANYGHEVTISGSIYFPAKTSGFGILVTSQTTEPDNTLTILGDVFAPLFTDTTNPLIRITDPTDAAGKTNTLKLYGFIYAGSGSAKVLDAGRSDTTNNLLIKRSTYTNGTVDDANGINQTNIFADVGGGSGADQSEYGLLPRYYDDTATNIFVDPSYVGTEAGTIAQPYTTMSEAETALEATTGGQHVHVYIKSGEYVDPIEITDGRGQNTIQRNRIATYGGNEPAIIGQFNKTRPNFTQVGATNVWTTPASTIAGFYALTTRFKRSTDDVVHDVDSYTTTTITSSTLSGYTGLVGCQVDYQESPFNFRTARITAFNGTDTITLDTTEAGNIAFLGGTITHTFKIYGMRSELDAEQQWASENVSGDNLVAVYSTADPNSLSPFFIPMYNESSIKVGTLTTQTNSYWEIDNINFQWNGRDAIEVQGDYTGWRITNCKFQNSLRCGISFFGSFNNTANANLEVLNNSIYDYGASGFIQWRARKPKVKNMVIGYGDGHDDGEFYGARFAVASSNTVNVFGAAISCVYYRDVVGGDPLDDARADGEYSNILIFGTYENGILMSGYGNRVSATYIRGHSIFCTDTGGIYNGSDFSHRLAYDGVFVNGETTLSSMRDQYIGGTGEIGSVGAVHGFYTDNFSYNTSHRNCVAINNTDGFGFFRNVRGHYNSYKDCLAANNLVGYFRGDVFGGATNPAKFTEFERNTILSIGRSQKAWYWFASGVTITDEIRGTHNGNLYLHLGDGGKFTPQVTGINATRAQTGTSLETAKEVVGGIDENSRSMGLWEYYPVTDYTEVAEIVNGAITDFSSDVLSDFGTVTYNATDDCYEVTPGSALNIGDIDTSNVLDIPNSFFDYTPSSGDVLTFVMEFEADQEGMYFDFGIYNGSSVEERYIVSLKRGRHTYILQHICETNFGGTWYIPTRPIKSSEEDGLTYKFHSCVVYRGTGSEYGSIEAIQNYIKDDTTITNESATMFMEELAVSSERPTDTAMMIPELTGGIQLLTSDPDGEDIRIGLSCRFTRNDAFVKSSLITTALLGLEGAREVKKIIEMKDQTSYDALPTATKETPGYVFLVPE